MSDTQSPVVDRAAAVAPESCAAALAALRESRPLVQCLTNLAAATRTVDVLLAAGATAALVDTPREAEAFAREASAVLINLGTPYEETVAAKRAAVAGATAEGTPWVIDPVGAGALPWRADLARQLLAAGPPSAIRGNASEILGLADGIGRRAGRGVDATDDPESAAGAARLLALQHDCVVAVSGPVDLITDGHAVVRVSNGHPWQGRVTGMGCALGALMAAFCAVAEGCLTATTTATALLGVAAEEAAATSNGPGTFAAALLDRLALITPEQLAERVRLSA